MKPKNGLIEISVVSEDGGVIKTLVPVDRLREFMVQKKGATVTFYKNGEEVYSVEFEYKNVCYMVNRYEMMKYSYVPNYLSKYLMDFTSIVASLTSLPTVGRDEEVRKAWFYLSQEIKNNVFLVGEIDTGKTTIAQELIRQIVTAECPEMFYGKRVISFKFDELLEVKSNFKYEYIIDLIMDFIEKNKDDIIFYFDDALMLKMDEKLIKILHFIVKNNIPAIFCCRTKEYEDLYLEDYFIKKYENTIIVEEPEIKEIYPMIENHLNSIMNTYQVKISEKMAKFAIYTSDLLNSHSCNPGRTLDVLNKAAIYAQIHDKKEIDKECILNCYDSENKLFNAMSQEEKRRIAYHESGHFIVLRKSKNVDSTRTAFISIIPSMSFLGVNWNYAVREKSLDANYETMLDEIAMFLGGRIAEKEITKVFSAGASSDLDVANSIAENMLMQYGLSEGDNQNRSFVVGGYYVKDYLLTNKNKEKINKEIRAIIKKAYKRAEHIIKTNRKLLDIIAEKLLKEYIITEDDLNAIIEEYEKTK